MTYSRRPSKRHVIALVVLGAILVLGIIAVLTVLGLREGRTAFDRVHILRAKTTTANLNLAVESFLDEYSHPPVASHAPPLRTDGGGLMDALLGLPTGLRFYAGSTTSKGRGGLVFPPSTPPTGVKLLDPWGHPYFVLIDPGGSISDPFNPAIAIPGRRAISWSAGPDGKANPATPGAPGNRDNVYSWR